MSWRGCIKVRVTRNGGCGKHNHHEPSLSDQDRTELKAPAYEQGKRTRSHPRGARNSHRFYNHTFTIDNDATSSGDVIAAFPPSPFAKLVFISKSREVLLHTSHWRSGGLGVLLLLDSLLTLASASLPDPSSLPWGQEVSRLAPSVEHALSIPKEPTTELKQRAQEVLETIRYTSGSLGIPYDGDASTVPAGTRSVLLTLSAEGTSSIVAACKARKVTVTSALHASVAGANYALTTVEDREALPYVSTMRFALRRFLPEPFPAPGFAAGLYTTRWMKRVEPGTSWEERLHTYQDAYRKGIGRDFINSHREFAAGLVKLIRNMPPEGDGGPPPSGVDISNIGIAEQFVKQFYGKENEGGFAVEGVSVGVEMLTRQAVMFAWTFRNRLNLSVVYNELFHSTEQMVRFVKEVESQLCQGLGIATLV